MPNAQVSLASFILYKNFSYLFLIYFEIYCVIEVPSISRAVGEGMKGEVGEEKEFSKRK